MLKAFSVAFRLKNAYRTNGIIWSLKSIPLIKRLLPASLYASRGLKVFANMVSGVLEFNSVFIGKAIYLALVFFASQSADAVQADAFAHMLIFLTLCGGFLNTAIFDPTKDKYYAMFIMRMDAKLYAVTDYLYFLIKMLVGFAAFSALFGALAGAGAAVFLAAPVYVICVKLIFAAMQLRKCKRLGETVNENSFTAVKWLCSGALVLLAMLPPFLGFALDSRVLPALTLALLVPSAFALRYILRFDAYRPIYKRLLSPERVIPGYGAGSKNAAAQLAMQKKITADFTKTSNKSGYKYFNELFMKRHSKLLTRSAKWITVGAAVVFALAAAALLVFPDARPVVNELLMTYLPYFLFVMYLINRGRPITQAMFMNCDHSMLAYRFYRTPKVILALFVERLKYIALINLMPALVIAAGLPLLLFISGGTEEPLNYAVLFVSIIAMSLFFSVHSMVLYYLLQPYNVNLESKSATYGILNWLTYMASYAAIQLRLPTLQFGTAISAFCLIYAAVAFILAYRLAPRTFRLRN